MKHIKTWMLSLLLMMTSLPLFAQTLEYWFDNRVSSRRTVSIRGDEATETFDIPTSSLTQGLHWLHFRVHDSSGYSGISSSPFFKYDPSTGNQIEYWFDGDYDQHVTADLSASADNLEALLNLRSNQFPIGFHQLNYRFGTAAGMAGPIYSAFVMKVGGGESSYLEYWLDEDQAHSKTIEGTVTADGEYSIIADLDLNDIAPGFHRLYYRASSQSSHTVGAVSMTPIMVKSMYAPDTEGLKIKKLRASITPVSSQNEANAPNRAPRRQANVVNGTNSIDLSNLTIPVLEKEQDVATTIDLSFLVPTGSLAPGEYQIAMQAENSASIKSPTVTETLIIEDETPKLGLTAFYAGGRVVMQWPRIASDIKYYVKRIGPDGARTRTIATIEKFSDMTVHFEDYPSETGDYQYLVVAEYYNRQNQAQLIVSNKASFTINSIPQSLEEFSSLSLLLAFDSVPTGYLPTGSKGFLVQCYDANGQLVTEKKTTTNNGRLWLDGFARGSLTDVKVTELGAAKYEAQEVTLGLSLAHNSATIKMVELPAEKQDLATKEYEIINFYIDSKFSYDADGSLRFYVINHNSFDISGKIGLNVYQEGSTYYTATTKGQYLNTTPVTLKAKQRTQVKIPLSALNNTPGSYNLRLDFIRNELAEPMNYDASYGITNPIQGYIVSGSNVAPEETKKWTSEEIETEYKAILSFIKNQKKIENIIGYSSVIENNSSLFSIKRRHINVVFESELSEAIGKLTTQEQAQSDVEAFYSALGSTTGNKYNDLFTYYARAWEYINSNEGKNNYFAQLMKRFLDVSQSLANTSKDIATCDEDDDLTSFIYEHATAIPVIPSIFEMPITNKNTGTKILITEVGILNYNYSAGIDAASLIMLEKNGNNVSSKVFSLDMCNHSSRVLAFDLDRDDAKKIDISKKHTFIIKVKWKNGRISYLPLNKNQIGTSEINITYKTINLEMDTDGSNWDKTVADHIITKD